jgi:hypothetical protein
MNVDDLADHINKCARGRQRFIVAIAGPPGGIVILTSYRHDETKAGIFRQQRLQLPKRPMLQRGIA